MKDAAENVAQKASAAQELSVTVEEVARTTADLALAGERLVSSIGQFNLHQSTLLKGPLPASGVLAQITL